MPDHSAARMLRDLPAEFLQRYNRQGPRYTSYPTVPEWTASVTEQDFRDQIRRGAAQNPRSPISLYVHIPFCARRCFFCACNVIVSRSEAVADTYIEHIDREMAILSGDMAGGRGRPRPVSQVHLGGGTPTHLTPGQLERLFGFVRARFPIDSGAEISIEANPCVTTPEHLEILARIGFNRISFGVQDFHPPTQKAIARVQSPELTRRLTDQARSLGFQSVNYDLVYGLPHQTAETFTATLDLVIEHRPDRVAFYNFAYLPHILKAQKVIDASTMPSGPEKFRIFTQAYERFLEAGYEYIGMDHYAVSTDSLARARRSRTLQRNFMGYTTQAGADLVAFGTSSISMTDSVYVQNRKKLSDYEESLAAGHIPTERGILLSKDDCIRRDVIRQIMCHSHLSKPEVEAKHGIRFDTYFARELDDLAPMESDGLVSRLPDRLEVTLLGTIFVRNVAMVFDAYLRSAQKRSSFSRTL